jgi:hypothetical protein
MGDALYVGRARIALSSKSFSIPQPTKHLRLALILRAALGDGLCMAC